MSNPKLMVKRSIEELAAEAGMKPEHLPDLLAELRELGLIERFLISDGIVVLSADPAVELFIGATFR